MPGGDRYDNLDQTPQAQPLEAPADAPERTPAGSRPSYARIERDARSARRIGPYLVLDKIGQGASGLVLKARHEILEREVALKILRPEVKDRAKFASRFLREARLASRIESPHVVRVHDAGEWDGLLYQALQLVEGGDLEERLRREGPMAFEAAAPLVADCLRGLAAIRDAGLVHRDIKPGNIFLGEDGRALLGDMGLARAVEGEGERTALTTLGQPVGTPAFMSPEQARGDADIDIRTDIYALGATLHTLLSGEGPFRGATNYEVMAKVLFEPLPDPAESLPDAPAAAHAILRRAMDKAPADRYASPEEFLADIEAALAGAPLPHAERVLPCDEPPPAPEPEAPLPAPEAEARGVGAILRKWFSRGGG